MGYSSCLRNNDKTKHRIMLGKMNFRTMLTLVVVGFCFLCGWLVADSGLFEASPEDAKSCILLQKTTGNQKREDADSPGSKSERLEAANANFTAAGGPLETVILGARDPNTEDPDIGFKLQLELTSQGAAIRKATFSNGNDNGFDNRNHENPQPLVILSPVSSDIWSLANKQFANDALMQQKRELRL